MAPFSNLAGGLGSLESSPRCRGARGGPDLVGGKQARGATELALAAANAFDRFVALAKMRWRIERDYQELKQEARARALEGRGWRGFHHHATLCIAAYAFLVAERARIPPQNRHVSSRLLFPPVRPGDRPASAAWRASIACLAILRSECLLLNVQVIVDRLARERICSNHLLDGELLKQDRQRLAS